MEVITQFLQTAWGALVAFGQQTTQSHWFPLLVGAAALSVILGLFNFGLSVARRPSGNRMPFWIAWIELKFLFTGELIPLACLWLAFATPFDRLPFTPPSIADSWLFLPAHTTYIVIAVLAHGILSIYGAIVLTIGWLIQLHTPDEGRIDVTILTAALIAVIVGWEIQGWPELFLVSFEFVLALIVAILAGAIVVGPQRLISINESGTSQEKKEAITRVYLSSFLIVMTVCLFYIVLWHQIDLYIVAFAALYYVLTLFDGVFMAFFDTASYRRAFILFPFILLLTYISASGLLRIVTHDSSISYSLWLEVGVAVAVYMLLYPLTEMAREAVKDILLKRASSSQLEFFSYITELLLSIGSKNPRQIQSESEVLPSSSTVVDADPAKHQAVSDTRVQTSTRKQRETKNPFPFSAMSPASGEELQRQAEIVYRALNARIWIILLIATLVFHYFAGFPDVLAGLGGNLLTVVCGVLSLFAGIFALLASQDNDPARNVLLLVLMLTMGVIAGDVLLNYVPIATGPFVIVPSRSILTLIHDQRYNLVTLHTMCQELLFLLAVGQITYLVVVVNANLRKYEAALAKSHQK